ncbi:unnamed protein product [Symbiodinium natans]|uniref:Uncharacterized protein n=1 Tax=Symbiodinium natans TaxID=878477 RepID=A0A812I4Q9_9DINO|nr:unnamed protein product [Symbiodinium natans]
MEVVGTATALAPGSMGEGQFSMAEDREKLAPVMRSTAEAATLKGGIVPAMGGQALSKNLVGYTTLQVASGYGALAAAEELLSQRCPGPLELSRALWNAATFRGGSAELVHRLVEPVPFWGVFSFCLYKAQKDIKYSVFLQRF